MLVTAVVSQGEKMKCFFKWSSRVTLMCKFINVNNNRVTNYDLSYIYTCRPVITARHFFRQCVIDVKLYCLSQIVTRKVFWGSNMIYFVKAEDKILWPMPLYTMKQASAKLFSLWRTSHSISSVGSRISRTDNFSSKNVTGKVVGPIRLDRRWQ